MACQELQRGETLASLKRESDTLKKKLEEERGKLNDVECESIFKSNNLPNTKMRKPHSSPISGALLNSYN